MRKAFRFLAAAVFVFSWAIPAAYAAQDEGHEEFDPVHHTSDGYYLDFEPLGKVELPRIFVVRRADGSLGVDFFGSTMSAIRSGKYRIAPDAYGAGHGEAAPAEGGHDEAGHGAAGQGASAGEGFGLGQTPAEGFEVGQEDVGGETGSPAEHSEALVAGSIHLESALEPADGGAILVDLSITRHLVFAILAALVVCAIFISLARRYQRGVGRDTAPKGLFQNLFETLVVFVRDEIAKPNLGDKYRKFLPYLLTAFFFILTCNLLGLIPFGATATANLMVTATLATFTFLVTQFSASKDHWKHIFWPPGVPVAVKPILIPVEFLGLFTKPFALAIRLFANMTAGHLVILSLIGLIFSFATLFGPGAGYGVSPVSVAFSLFIYLLELLVAFIQAYIFTMLSALFIGMAVAEHHHEHDDHHAHADLPLQVHGDHGPVTPHLITGDHVHGATSERPAPAPAH